MPSKNTYFKKGQKGYWSGKKFTKEHTEKIRQKSIINWHNGRSKILLGLGAENHSWKGDKIGYAGIHKWLQNTFGKATKCEQCGSENNVQWAKLKDKEYQRRRENFWMLCAICHIDYDNTSISRFVREHSQSSSSTPQNH